MAEENQSGSTMTVTNRTAVGATLLIGARLSSRCLDLLMLAVLANFLAPADFGLIAIAMTLLLIVEVVFELPVIMALVRLSEVTPADYNTAFTLALIRGVSFVALMIAMAWPFAQFYGDGRLVGLICALSIAPAARGLTSPRLADFMRNLDFRREAAIDICGKLVACIAAISTAWFFRSYWAIAVATIVAPITMATLSYILAPYRPRLTLKKWHVFSGFIKHSTATQVVAALNWQIDQLLLGKFVNQERLGFYSMASNIASLPWQLVQAQGTRPLLGAFSLIRDDRSRLQFAYKLSAHAALLLTIPALVGLAFLARPIVLVVLGEKWIDAGDLLWWLCLVNIPQLFAMPVAALVLSLNQTVFFCDWHSWSSCSSSR
jgi:PST family polysaccharide transporter